MFMCPAGTFSESFLLFHLLHLAFLSLISLFVSSFAAFYFPLTPFQLRFPRHTDLPRESVLVLCPF